MADGGSCGQQSLSETPILPPEYETVAVLQIKWTTESVPDSAMLVHHSSSGASAESANVSTTSLLLPWHISERRFIRKVNDWVDEKQCKRSLLAIHYMGHTDEALSLTPPSSVMIEAPADVQTDLKWDTILGAIVEKRTDVLLLFDCTVNAQARCVKQSLNVELEALASYSPNVERCSTFPFSESLIQGFCADMKILSYVAVSRVHYQTGGRHQVIHIVPVWANELPEYPSKVFPELKVRETSPPPLPPRSTYPQAIDYLIEEDVRGIGWWKQLQRLKSELSPDSRKGLVVQMLLDLDKIYETIFDSDTNPDELNTHIQINAQAREELQDLWNDFVSLGPTDPTIKMWLKNCVPLATDIADEFPSFFEQVLHKIIRLFIPFLRTLWITLLAAPCLNSIEKLQKATGEKILEDLGLMSFLELRLLGLTGSPPLSSWKVRKIKADSRGAAEPKDKMPSLIPSNIVGYGTVLLEYKLYVQTDVQDKKHLGDAILRVRVLAEALGYPKLTKASTLKCVSWFHQPTLNRFGLAFAFPEGVSGEFISLYEMMTRPTSSTNPGLGCCFRIALAVGESLQHWHLSGWLHGAISSRNVVFFFSHDGTQVLWDKPYICGFEYARPNAVPSSARFIEDFAINVYNHPERQGGPTDQHRKVHDLYSFGVVMCEIAAWQTAEGVFASVDKRTLSPRRMQQLLLKYAEDFVGYHMGTKYMRSAITCLKGDFGVEEDDAVDTKLMKAFDKLVLRNLEHGLKVD